jgi:hypothetical protein
VAPPLVRLDDTRSQESPLPGPCFASDRAPCDVARGGSGGRRSDRHRHDHAAVLNLFENEPAWREELERASLSGVPAAVAGVIAEASKTLAASDYTAQMKRPHKASPAASPAGLIRSVTRKRRGSGSERQANTYGEYMASR